MENRTYGMVLRLFLYFNLFQNLDGYFQEDESSDSIETLQSDIKYLEIDLAHFKTSIDITEVEKMEIEGMESVISLIAKKMNDQNLQNYFEEEIFIEQHYPQILKYRKDIDILYEQLQTRKDNRLAVKSVEAIKTKNYKTAIKTLMLINNYSKINEIINEVYNKDKNNFYIIRDVADEIPSISLSFTIYKTLKRIVEENNHTDENSNFALFESITTNVTNQISTDEIIKLEAEIILEDLELSLKKTMVQKVESLVHDGDLDSKLENILHRITSVLKRYKFLRDVSERAVEIVYPKFGFSKVMTSLDSIKLVQPKIIILHALYMEIAKTGETAENIGELITIQNSIHNAYNQSEGFEEIWPFGINVKFSLIRQLKRAILNGYYLENEISNLTTNAYKTDEILFLDVMKIVVKGAYRKINTLDMLRTFEQGNTIGPNIVGYISVYEVMKENCDLVLKDAITLLNLFRFAYKTLKFTDFGKSNLNMVVRLKGITEGLIKNTIITNNSTMDSFQEHHGIKGNFEQTLAFIMREFFEWYSIDTVFDAALVEKDPITRLLRLIDIQDKTPKHSPYLFQVAENFKNVELELNGNISLEYRMRLEKSKRVLPLTVKNIVFASEVYIKNLKRGGEYLCLFKNLNNSVFTYVPGSRGNHSKWVLEYSRNPGIYKIKNIEFNELLYAGQPYDDENRLVFSAEKGQFNEDLSDWNLLLTEGGVFIKSVIYQEYLVTGRHRKKDHRQVFTIKSVDDVSETKWAIEEYVTTY